MARLLAFLVSLLVLFFVGMFIVWPAASWIWYNRPDPGAAPRPTAVSQPAPTSVPTVAAPAATMPPVATQPIAGPGGQTGGGQLGGTAGMAPQSVEQAAQVLGVDTPQYLTVLYPRPGDPTAIGWVLGTSASESAGTVIRARTIPSGVCVDFDHNASRLSGSIARSERLTANWTRTLLSSQGSLEGLKMTAYWSPCVFTGGGGPIYTPQGSTISQGAAPAAVPTSRPSEDKSASSGSRSMDDSRSSSTDGNTQCLKGTEDAARVIGGNATNWSVLPHTNGEGLKYKGPSVPLKAPNHGRVDTPSGELRNGEAGKAGEATYWCNG